MKQRGDIPTREIRGDSLMVVNWVNGTEEAMAVGGEKEWTHRVHPKELRQWREEEWTHPVDPTEDVAKHIST